MSSSTLSEGARTQGAVMRRSDRRWRKPTSMTGSTRVSGRSRTTSIEGRGLSKNITPTNSIFMPRKQGMCKKCGVRKTTKRNKDYYRTTCSRCHLSPEKRKRANDCLNFSINGRLYRLEKKERCEQCNFLPKHPVQLDVDHIDGNHKNNNVQNLKTLCANCHRLKTWYQKENVYLNGLITMKNGTPSGVGGHR